MNGDIDWMALIRNERILEAGQTYGSVAEPWQLAMDEALLTSDRAYAEFPRGHDKTGRLACHSLCWLLEGSGKHAYATGVDRDNAKLFRNEMQSQVHRAKSSIFNGIEFFNYVVENRRNGNVMEILASDAPSNIGLKFNLLLINDFVDWKDQKFFEVLLSATGKIPNVKIWMESNAGTQKRGYKWEMREYARSNKRWFFKSTKKWLASWTQKEWFKEMGHILSPAAYRRLIGNEWIEEADAFLTKEQVEAATNPALRPSLALPKDVEFCATACDLGIAKDATAVGTLGKPKGDKPIRLLDLRVFPGSRHNPPQIVDVEREIDDQYKRFGSAAIVLDPWNMRKTIQEKIGEWPIIEFNFSPANLMHLTADVFRRIVNKQVELYPNAGRANQSKEEWDLQRELCTAIIRQMPYGERVDHRKSGYTDRIITVGMALWWLGQEEFPGDQREFGIHII